MPITPGEAIATEKSGTDGDFDFHCRNIDGHLKEGGRTVQVRDMGGLLLNRILSAYRAAGWIVSTVSDWRDGDYLQFEEP